MFFARKNYAALVGGLQIGVPLMIGTTADDAAQPDGIPVPDRLGLFSLCAW